MHHITHITKLMLFSLFIYIFIYIYIFIMYMYYIYIYIQLQNRGYRSLRPVVLIGLSFAEHRSDSNYCSNIYWQNTIEIN